MVFIIRHMTLEEWSRRGGGWKGYIIWHRNLSRFKGISFHFLEKNSKFRSKKEGRKKERKSFKAFVAAHNIVIYFKDTGTLQSSSIPLTLSLSLSTVIHLILNKKNLQIANAIKCQSVLVTSPKSFIRYHHIVVIIFDCFISSTHKQRKRTTECFIYKF